MAIDLRHFQMKHKVTYYECDQTGHLKLSMAFALAILVSEQHDEAVRQASGEALDADQAWVVTNYQADFAAEQPHNDEEILLETEYTSANRFFAQRRYWIKGLAGQIYAKIDALFVMISLTKRKMVPISAANFKAYQLNPSTKMPKLAQPQEVADSTQLSSADYHVRYFDLDSNRHVNNARYFDWLLDPLGADFLLHHCVRSVAIRYRHEVRYPSTISSQWAIIENGNEPLTTVHQINVGSTVNVNASFTWDEK